MRKLTGVILGLLFSLSFYNVGYSKTLPYCLSPSFHSTAEGVYHIIRNGKDMEDRIVHLNDSLETIKELHYKDVKGIYELKYEHLCRWK